MAKQKIPFKDDTPENQEKRAKSYKKWDDKKKKYEDDDSNAQDAVMSARKSWSSEKYGVKESKFDNAINSMYKQYLLEAEEDPATEPGSEGEQKVTVSDTELAQARKYVDRKKILGMNIGKSKDVKKELRRKKDLDDEYDTNIMPDVLARLQQSNDALQSDIDSVKELGF